MTTEKKILTADEAAAIRQRADNESANGYDSGHVVMLRANVLALCDTVDALRADAERNAATAFAAMQVAAEREKERDEALDDIALIAGERNEARAEIARLRECTIQPDAYAHMCERYAAMRTERDNATAEIARLTAVIAERDATIAGMIDDAGMACESPQPGCGCAGCIYAAERAAEGHEDCDERCACDGHPTQAADGSQRFWHASGCTRGEATPTERER